jgi:hypothetical protein
MGILKKEKFLRICICLHIKQFCQNQYIQKFNKSSFLIPYRQNICKLQTKPGFYLFLCFHLALICTKSKTSHLKTFHKADSPTTRGHWWGRSQYPSQLLVPYIQETLKQDINNNSVRHLHCSQHKPT